MSSKSRDITRRLFQGAVLTMLVAELTGAASAFVDGVITGRYLGDEAMAAAGIADPYFSIAAMIRFLLMAGCVTLCTRVLGKGDRRRAGQVFSMTITAGVISSLILMILGLIFAPRLATLLGARGEAAAVHPVATEYLRGLFLGAPAFILFIVLIPILQLDGDSKRPKIASFSCALVNICGDLLNVFVFKGGMLGMGLATTVSQYAALLVTLTHFIKRDGIFRFSLKGLQLPDLPQLAKEGMPSAVSMFSRAMLPVLINPWTVTIAGAAGLTALSVQHNLTFLIESLGWGIGGAVLMMAGISAGEQDAKGLSRVVKTGLWDIVWGVGAITLLVFLLAGPLAGFYLPEGGEATGMAKTAIRLYALALPFIAFNELSANFFQATGRRVSAHLVNIGSEVACVIGLAWILGRLFGPVGIWASFPAGQALLSLLIVLRAALGRDKNRKGLGAWLMLKPSFGVPEEDYISSELHSLEEVSAFSRQVGEFCLAHGLSARHANHIALCVEEMAGNVVEHGFGDGREHYLDVRITRKDPDTVIRIRDDCMAFDFKEKAAAWTPDPEHPESNIGIRIVMSLARDIAYANTMNTNNLTITL